MHDLVNDLAKYVSREFYLCFEEDREAKKVSKMTRHFSYLTKSREGSKQFEAIYEANKLRTFLNLPSRISSGSMSSKMIHDLLSKFKRLRILSICNYSINFFEVPDSIGNLKHLRYFNLSGSAIKRLPDSICFLYSLEILKLTYCRYLEELPSDMQKLINLRHLDFRGTKVRKMPNGLGKLENLEVLSSFYVGKCSESNIKQLAELKLQGTLTIEELQNVIDPMDALASNLKNKIHLETLCLVWSTNDDGSQNERDVLEKLQPPMNLKVLSIQKYGGTRFPNWFRDKYMPNIVSLELSNCQYCFSLPPLGILHSLKKLHIEGLEGIKVIGPEFHGNNSSAVPFASLQVLSFVRMDGWEEWDCQNASGAFPCLKELHIKYCSKLKNQLPEHLPSLLELEICNCMQLVACLPRAPDIYSLDIRDCGNLHWESRPSTLKYLYIAGQFKERSFHENAMHPISNTCHSLNCLQSLILRRCDSLKSLSLHFFPKLQSLKLYSCSNLERLSIYESLDRSLTSLTVLYIYECPKFVSFLEGGISAPNLKTITIEKLESLKSFPDSMHTLFPSLTNMLLSDCPQLEWREGCLPSSLKTLRIFKCPKLVASRMKWDDLVASCT